ncbi:MAG: RecX family transcriptional regulator [Deltaproteobacteria bacterium]|nr:RecX family transcriptional regulator [Deltaproteobacteria bacterium]
MSEESTQRVLDRVLDLGYLDDREYAVRRARLMAEKGWGDFPIRLSLEELGIPEAMADEALSRVLKEFSEEERIAMLIEKRKGLKREKMVRFLAGRGFAFDKILNILDEVDA